MISDKKRLEISNVCYANVAGQFAMFTNENFRGPTFTWDWWVNRCEEEAAGWMFVHSVRGNKEEINEIARRYAREIAERLLYRAGLK